MTPTRELATQIDEVLADFLTEFPHFTHKLLIGGNNPVADITKFVEEGYVCDFSVEYPIFFKAPVKGCKSV